MLSMANKLPIPGVHSVTNQLNKYTKFMGGFGGGGGKRGLDDEDGDGIFAGSELGGSTELLEAAAHADRYGADARSPSPMPMQAPAGYEMYGRQEGSGGYFEEGQIYQYQTSYQDPYQEQHGGTGYH